MKYQNWSLICELSLICADIFPAEIECEADTVVMTNITECPDHSGAVGKKESLDIEDLDGEEDGLCCLSLEILLPILGSCSDVGGQGPVIPLHQGNAVT